MQQVNANNTLLLRDIEFVQQHMGIEAMTGKVQLVKATARLLTVQDFADAIGISVWTARQYAYTGKIASVKIGRRLQIPASEVDRIIDQNLRPVLQTA